jgi:RNA polymerase sigma-70 factor (ECF subfamily)
MAAYANGDAKAFEVVYDAVEPRLRAYLIRHLRNGTRVDDIIQQTFLQMHAARATFIPGSEVQGWAFGIAKRVSIDLERKAWREEPTDLWDADKVHGERVVSSEATGEEILQARQTGERVAAAIEELSGPQQAALDLRCQGLSGARAASLLNTTSTGFKLRVHRALQALRAALWDGSELSRPRPDRKRKLKGS